MALLNRLKLEGDKAEAGVVLGLDTNLVTEAKATGLFSPHGIDTSAVTVPGGYSDDVFVPFDYGHFAVVYDTKAIKTPPSSLKELVDGDSSEKIVIEDPRTSTPGLGLLLWSRRSMATIYISCCLGQAQGPRADRYPGLVGGLWPVHLG